MIQLQGSPVTPVNSHSSSISEQSTPQLISEEFDSSAGHACYAVGNELQGTFVGTNLCFIT